MRRIILIAYTILTTIHLFSCHSVVNECSNVPPNMSWESDTVTSTTEESNPPEIISGIDNYTTITYYDNKKIATIYNTEIIANILTKRDENNFDTLSLDTIRYIVEDTLELFQANDVVIVYDIHNNVNTYYGSNFYHSPEYLTTFGVLNRDLSEVSFDYKRDMIEVIFKRIEALHSNIFDGFESDSKYVLVTSQEISDSESNDFFNALFNVYELGSTSPSVKNVLADYPIAAFFFDFNDKGVGFIPDISHADPSKVEQLLPDSILPPHVSPTKYDYNGKVVVVELYESATKKLIARLRFDEKQNPDIISDIQVRFNQFTTNFSGSGNAEQSTNYRAVVYLNGFAFASSNDTCILYCPDGDLNLSNFSGGYNIFQHNIFFQKGCQPLTEYINELLRTNLTA